MICLSVTHNEMGQIIFQKLQLGSNRQIVFWRGEIEAYGYRTVTLNCVFLNMSHHSF